MPLPPLVSPGARLRRAWAVTLVATLYLVPLGTAVAAGVSVGLSSGGDGSSGSAASTSSGPGGTSGGGTTSGGGATSSAAPAAVASADLQVTKTDSQDPATVGSNFAYTITVRNNGPDRATNVVVTDTLPAGVSVVSAGSCSVSGQTVTCTRASLANAASAVFTITVKAETVGEWTNTVSVDATEADPVSSNDQDTETTVIRTAAPSGLTCTANPSGVQLDWSDTPQATGYNVYRRTGETGDFVLLTSTTASQHLDTTAAVGQSYQYRVTATSAGGESNASQICTVASVPEFPTIAAGALAVVGCLGALHVWRRRG